MSILCYDRMFSTKMSAPRKSLREIRTKIFRQMGQYSITSSLKLQKYLHRKIRLSLKEEYQ